MVYLYGIVKRGKNAGITVTPHRYANGKYKVAKRKEDTPIEVDFREIADYIRQGYGVRMGNTSESHPPGLFMPPSIVGL